MNEEIMNTEVNAAAAQEAAVAEAAKSEPAETMADFASELEASYKEFDERHND